MPPSSQGKDPEDYKWVPYDRLDAEERAFLDDMFDWLVNDSNRSVELSESMPNLDPEGRQKIMVELYNWGLLRLSIVGEGDEDISIGFEVRLPDGTWKPV